LQPIPPGPTRATERVRPVRERLKEAQGGLLAVVANRFQTFGDVYFMEHAKKPMYVMRHPDHLREVLVSRASSFEKRTKDLDAFLGRGLLTSDGDLWRRQRRLIQPAFHSARLARYAQTMVDEAEAMLEGWHPEATRDLGRDLSELTFRIISKTILDHDPKGQAQALAHAMTILQRTGGALDALPRWLAFLVEIWRRRAMKLLDGIIDPMIDAHEDPSAGDLISELKFASDENGRMSRQQLRDELATLCLAGHETTALAVTWTFALLAQYPEEEAKLHAEVDRVLAGRRASFSDLETLVHTRNVVQEAMRLFPPLYVLPRIAAEDTTVAGYAIPKGASVVLWIFFCHRDERWFPRPTTFWPDRFLSGSNGQLHPHAYLPFGAGPRACIGRHFGLAEAQLLVATIAKRYRLRMLSGRPIGPRPRVTLGPTRPIRMRLEPRA
jgi:cytochrome P450